MRILIAGDTHGNAQWCNLLSTKALELNCERIFVVGDFGFWPGPGGMRFLDYVQQIAEDDGIPWDWLDGNHEWHDALDPYRSADKPWEMRPGITYYPRGHRFEWDGVRVMSLGGAWSIDKDSRTPHVSWWPQEELTVGDVMRALDGPEVDLLLTHDMPNASEAISALGFQMHPGGASNRMGVSTVMEALKPKMLIHGHMHRAYDVQVGPTRVMGLDCDGVLYKSWYVYDTDVHHINNA